MFVLGYQSRLVVNDESLTDAICSIVCMPMKFLIIIE